MQTLYQVDRFGYFTGVVTEINDAAGFQRGAGGWFEIAPPSLADGEYAVINGDGWRVTTDAAPPIPQDNVVVVPPEHAAHGEAPAVI